MSLKKGKIVNWDHSKRKLLVYVLKVCSLPCTRFLKIRMESIQGRKTFEETLYWRFMKSINILIVYQTNIKYKTPSIFPCPWYIQFQKADIFKRSRWINSKTGTTITSWCRIRLYDYVVWARRDRSLAITFEYRFHFDAVLSAAGTYMASATAAFQNTDVAFCTKISLITFESIFTIKFLNHTELEWFLR